MITTNRSVVSAMSVGAGWSVRPLDEPVGRRSIARRAMVAFCTTFALMSASLLYGQDVLTVGGATCAAGAPGSVVHLSVYIVDKSGTPLGSDQVAGNQIQNFSFQVTPSNLSAIATDAGGDLLVSVADAGITVGKSHNVGWGTATTATNFSFIGAYRSTTPLSFTLNAGAPGDLVADIAITLSSSATPGTSFNLTVSTSSAVTSLYNGAGTVPENAGNGLTLVDGCVAVQPLSVSLACPSTNVVSGSTGTGTVTIGAAETVATTVSLTSSNTAVATVPASVTIAAGQTSATFPVTGTGAGSATITATLPANVGGATAMCTTTVVNPNVSIALSCPSSNVVAGSTGTSTVTIGAAQATSTTVTLASSNPAVAAVPASVSIPAGATSATFQVTGVAAGASTITATMPGGLGGSSANCTTTVVNPTVTVSLSCPTANILAGATGTATVSIGTAQSSSTTITLASSNTGVVTVPANVSIPAGQTSATFQVTGVAAGASTITATMPGGLGGSSANCTTTVVNPTVTVSLSCPTANILAGATGTATVSIGTAQSSSTTITLASSNTGVVTVPANVSIPAGQTSATFQVTAIAAGTSTITATMPSGLGGTASSCTTTVNPVVTITLACPGANIVAGTTGTSTVTISPAQSSSITVTLSSSNTSTATVPASVSIPAGQTSATFSITGVAAGTSTITATLPAATGGNTATCSTTVANPTASVTLACPSADVVIGTTGTATVFIGSAQSSSVTITLSSSNTAVATVPATVSIPAGSTSTTFSVTGVAPGNSTLTATVPASLGAASATCTTSVVNPPVDVSLQCPSANIVAGGKATSSVVIGSGQTSSTSISLTTTNGAVATVPATVVIAAGQTSVTFDITAVGAGTARITATAPGSLGGRWATCTAIVVNPTISLTPKVAAVAVGAPTTMTVTISNAPASAVSIALASSNTAAATVPASVTIAAGATSATFDVTGVASGFATITATLPPALGGATDTAQATVSSAIVYFRASPTPISLGQSSTLSWSTVGAKPVNIDHNVGAQAATGSVTVKPATTTTYTLTTTGLSTTETAQVTVQVVAEPIIVINAYPEGMLQTANSGGSTDSFVLMNIGGASATISLSQTQTFFTQSPSSFTLSAGASQVVTINAPQQAPKLWTDDSSISINGVSSGLTVPIRLLSTAAPTGTVKAKPTLNQIFVASSDNKPTGSILFTNYGTATLQGIVVSDAEWLIPESGIITIDPGQSRAVTFTIDRSKRPDAGDLTGSVDAKLTLVYNGSTTGNATASGAGVLDTTTGSATSSVSVSDNSKPPLSVVIVSPVPAGQVAFFIPGVQSAAGTASAFLLQHTLPVGLPRDLGLFYAPATAASAGTAQLASLSATAPHSSIAFGNVVHSVFGNDGQVGSLQVRTTDFAKITTNANVMNVSNPQGFYGTTLVSLRSDRAVAASGATYLVGLRKDASAHTDVYLQEVVGGNATAQTQFLDENGLSLGSRTDTLGAFELRQFSNVPQGAVVATVTSDANSSGKFVARALITDETTGAPTDIVDWRLRNAISASDPLLIPIATTRHTATSDMHTEVVITNSGSSPATGTLSFPSTAGRRRAVRNSSSAPSGGATTSALRAETNGTMAITVAPQQTLRLPDVLSSLGITGDKTGYLVFTPAAGTAAITTQLRGSKNGDTFSVSVPALSASAGLTLSQSRSFAEIEDAAPEATAAGTGATFQSGFSMLEAAGKPVTVRVTLHFTSGTAGSAVTLRANVSKDYTLTSHQLLSFPNLARELLGQSRDTLRDLHSMQVDFTVIAGDGSAIPWVTSTDNGTGDPILRFE
jgi:trimeric autotransporter adhesin